MTYGFMNSGLLQDFSTSAEPTEHPYVYDHFPPRPGDFHRITLQGAGERYALARLIFALVFLLGATYFVRFVRVILEKHGLQGEGYAMLFVSFTTILVYIEHPTFSASPLFAFYPVVALHRYYQTGKRAYYYSALVVIALASVWMVITVFVSVLVGWGLLALLRLMRFDMRHLLTFLAIGAAGVVLHLVQNMVFLGPSIFFEELRVTLSNRIYGVPSPDEMMGFYRAHNIVLHGIHQLDWVRLLASFNQSLRFPGRFFIVMLGIVFVGWAALRVSYDSQGHGPRGEVGAHFRRTIWLLARLAVWAAGVIVPGFLLFPAYAAEYGLGGLNEFVLAVGATALLACVVRELAAGYPRRSEVYAGGWFVVTVALGASLVAVAHTQLANLAADVRSALGANPHAELLDIERVLRGRVVMTNAYPITAGFFTHAASFGGCGLTAFEANGEVDPSKCHLVFIAGYGRSSTVVPSHFVMFRTLFLNFSRCEGECNGELYDRVARRHVKIFENSLFTIFALEKVEPPNGRDTRRD